MTGTKPVSVSGRAPVGTIVGIRYIDVNVSCLVSGARLNVAVPRDSVIGSGFGQGPQSR